MQHCSRYRALLSARAHAVWSSETLQLQLLTVDPAAAVTQIAVTQTKVAAKQKVSKDYQF